jgi:hypothetical protein
MPQTMNKLKIQILLGLLVVGGLLLGFFAISSQQRLSESEAIKHPSKEVLIAQGHAQAIRDINAGNPKFYIYGLVTYKGTEKMQLAFKKHNITPVFQGCVIEEGSEYNFSYNKTIKNAFPDSKNIFNKYL